MGAAVADAHRHEHVLSFALEHPWAITRPMLSLIAQILGRRLSGQEPDPAEIQAALVNRKNLPQPGGGAVAIIPMYGVIAPRANLMSQMSGGTTFETLSLQLREAMGNKAVKTIVFDVDSPGGNVAGATEFAREVMKARAKKAIIAVAQYQMCSAAYWTMAGATYIYAAPSARVGSIGVFTIHEDLSKALEMEGINLTYISAGKYKVDGNETQPLSKESLARIQAKVNEPYERFLGDVSKGRGVSLADVRAGYGQGDSVSAADALTLGMIDKIATLDDTLASLMAVPVGGSMAPLDDNSASALDTPQEPSSATGQDRIADAHWQNTIEAELFALDL
jgi:signal peptide peptidase SppA